MHDTYNLFGNFRLEYRTGGDNTGNNGDGLNDGLTMMVWRENKKWIWTHGDHRSLVSLTLKPNPEQITGSLLNISVSLQIVC